MSRTRLSLDSIPPPDATFAQNQLGHEYEAFLLGPDVDAVRFPHWTAHLREFFGWYDEKPDYVTAEGDLHAVKDAISTGLAAFGYEALALEVEAAGSGDALNDLLIAQYRRRAPAR